MSEDVLRYDRLVENALREVIRQALSTVAADGLPGAHHFYITFRTSAPGVELAERLRTEHPQDMTIVLQHKFWDLVVEEDQFAVTLSFGGNQERMVVPYEALTAFVDPSVKFGLQFPASPGEATSATDAVGAAGSSPPMQIIQEQDQAAGAPAEVVNLDSFRKK